jgi:hypothetical protein
VTDKINAVAKPSNPEASTEVVEKVDGQNRAVGGSAFDVWNDAIAKQVWGTLWVKHSSEAQREEQQAAAFVGLMGIAPQNELEAMIAAQLLAAHHATLECYRRAAIPDQTFVAKREYLGQAGKLSRTFATLLEALNRHRGKGHEQKVTVQHVHIHDGSQAIVGAVEAPGEGGTLSKIVEQPHAQLTHAPVTPLRSTHPEGEFVPVARDEERTVQASRREINGSAARKSKRIETRAVQRRGDLRAPRDPCAAEGDETVGR